MSSSKNPTYSAVLEYLKAQNRPYSAIDIVNNLHKEHGKTAVQKALDLLVADGKIAEKLNGKQKAYVIRQEGLPSASDAELAELDAGVAAANQRTKELTDEAKSVEAEARKLEAEPTTEAAAGEAAVLAKEVSLLEKRLAALKAQRGGGDAAAGKAEREKVAVERVRAVAEWRKRKRWCGDVTDAILESYPKPKRTLFEEVGIETDEEVGVKVPES